MWDTVLQLICINGLTNVYASHNMPSLLTSTGHFPAISDDLVNSYHLLVCCLDLLYSNALYTKNRRELLNPNFEG